MMLMLIRMMMAMGDGVGVRSLHGNFQGVIITPLVGLI